MRKGWLGVSAAVLLYGMIGMTAVAAQGQLLEETTVAEGDLIPFADQEQDVFADEGPGDENPLSATDISGFVTVKDGVITKYSGMEIADVVIPSVVDGQTITGIGDEAFKDHKEIESVQFPNTLRSIGREAFRGVTFGKLLPSTTYSDLVIPASVDYIGYDAFRACSNLGTVTFESFQGTTAPEGIEFGYHYTNSALTGEGNTFSECPNLTEITLSNRTQTIVGFFACSDPKLTTVNWTSAVKDIGKAAFHNDPALVSSDLSGTATRTIGDSAFEGCTSLPAVRFPATLESIGMRAFHGSLMGVSKPAVVYGDVVIPASVNYIGYDAFRACSNLGTVTFEDFQGTTAPAGIEFGYHYTNSVLTGEGYTFSECPNLTEITLSNRTQTIVGFFACSDPKLTTVNWTSAVKDIGKAAFHNDPALVSSDLSGTATRTIGDSAFEGCTSLPAVRFPATLESIGMGAFKGSLMGVSKPAVIYGDVVIPASVNYIGYDAFRACSNLGTVTFEDFQGTAAPTEIEFGYHYTNSVLTGEGNTFSECPNLTEITLSNRTQTIVGLFACSDPKLTTVNWTSAVKDIGKAAFNNDKSLVTPDLSGTTTKTIGDSAFEGCTSLPAVRFPATLESIGMGAFKGTQMGESALIVSYGDVVIPASVNYIGYDAFRGCSHLGTVTFASYEGAGVPAEIEFGYHYTNSVLTGEGNTFSECPNLTEITLSNRTQTIVGLFACSDPKLTTVNWTSAVKDIGKAAFHNDPSLVSSDLSGTAAKTIGDSAFEGCTSLPAVRFPATLESIGTGAFKGSLMGGGTQTSYGDVVIPASVGHIGYDAFRGCGHLETVTFENYEGAGVPAEIEFGYHYTNNVLTGEGNTFSECPNLICVTLSNKTQTLPGYFAANDANLVHLIAPYAVTGIGTKAFYVENECGIVLTTESDSVRNYNWESDHRLVSSSAAAVRLEEESITIRKGETRTLTATVITVPEDAAKPGLVWKSDDNYETYVKVDQSGRVTGVSACSYELTVTATAAGNGGSASCKVKVTDSSGEQKVTGVKLNRNELTLGIGKTYLLTATVTPADAADKAVSWTSDKESVARVDSLGRVTGVSEGQATITVITHDGEKKDTCVVTVREGAPDPTPTPTPTDSASGLSPEATMTEDGKVFLVQGQTHVIGEGWAINGNTKVITLKRGVITAKKADSQPVTLTKDGETCKVYVSLPSVKVGGKKSARLILGGSAQVTLGGIPGAYLSYYPVSWVSSNPAVISLDTPVNGMITARAVSRGSAKVTAYVGGKPYRVTLTVANSGAVIPKKIASEATIVMDPMQSVVLKYSSFKPKNATWSSADDPLRDTAVNARSVVTAKGNGVVQVKLSNGKLTAVGEGETTLVGENGGRRVTLHIQVRALPSNPLVYLKTGASKKLTAPRLKANAAAWETVSGSDANVLTSWEKGQVKATSVLPEGAEGGHAQVRCSWKPVESGNGFTYYYDVFVENPSLREDASAGFAKGTKTGQYTLSLTEGQSFSLKEHYGNISQDVFWTSSNATIAYVDEYGTVHANTIGKTGNAVLQASVDGVRLKVTVTVTKAP